MRRWTGRLWVLGVVLAISLLLLAACGRERGETLTVLAGSELRDLEPLFDEIRENTGIQLEMTYIGTLDGAEQLGAGLETDLAWFSHSKYLTLLQDVGSRIAAQEKIMLSPVVLGVKQSQARAWGWEGDREVTWSEIAEKARSGELSYAMTNPASSNSGFTALVGVASALSGSGQALQVEDIDEEALRGFFAGQALTAGSSGWLAEAYVRDQGRLDGMINYESSLLALNASGELDEPLTLIYPREGIITADYPLMLVNSDKREQYDGLVAYLRSPEFQQLMMEQTLRRPVIPQVALSETFPDNLLVELPFPNTVEVVDALLFSFLDEQRVPAHAFFILDVSGSMEGERLDDLKRAMNNLAGQDQSLTGRFARFRNREQITLIPFSTNVNDVREFAIDDVSELSSSLEAVRDYVSGLRADGSTAIFSTLARAYSEAGEAKRANPDRYYSIVLMSDGENTAGDDLDQFLRFHESLPDAVKQIPTFTVLFGDADVGEMEAIAEATGGRVFDASAQSLPLIFKQIRGYQ